MIVHQWRACTNVVCTYHMTFHCITPKCWFKRMTIWMRNNTNKTKIARRQTRYPTSQNISTTSNCSHIARYAKMIEIAKSTPQSQPHRSHDHTTIANQPQSNISTRPNLKTWTHNVMTGSKLHTICPNAVQMRCPMYLSRTCASKVLVNLLYVW